MMMMLASGGVVQTWCLQCAGTGAGLNQIEWFCCCFSAAMVLFIAICSSSDRRSDDRAIVNPYRAQPINFVRTVACYISSMPQQLLAVCHIHLGASYYLL
jgi:hypothetical protein